jgi:hypothetical protein
MASNTLRYLNFGVALWCVPRQFIFQEQSSYKCDLCNWSLRQRLYWVYFNVKEADFVYMRRKCSGKASNLAKGLFTSIATPSGENVTLDKKKGHRKQRKMWLLTRSDDPAVRILDGCWAVCPVGGMVDGWNRRGKGERLQCYRARGGGAAGKKTEALLYYRRLQDIQLRRSKKRKKQCVVFLESRQSHIMGSPAILWQLIRLSPEPVFWVHSAGDKARDFVIVFYPSGHR